MYTGERLGRAIAEAIKEKKVSQKAVADHFGIKPPSVSGWIKTGRIAKEHIDKLIEYFSDVVPPSHFGIESLVPLRSIETLPLPPEDTETIRIDHLDMAGACGGGIEADNWPSPISSVEFPLDAVRRLFSGRDTSGLKIVGTRGDSMEPTIPETSAVLIDTKADTFTGDGIYFFAYAGGLYTKRLQKTPTGLLALSDNPLYQSFPIDENDRFRIIGRYYGVISLKLAQ